MPKLAEETLVSVIIPNYNCVNYLSKAIESILSQTHANLELLICDDGSTDDSLVVLEQWQNKDSRIRVMANGENKGHIYTYNRLFFSSAGRFVAIQDADDWSEPSRIEKQFRIIKEQSVDFCLCNYTCYQPNQELEYKPYSKSELININDNEQRWAPATLLFKRDILEVIPGYNNYFQRLTAMDRYFIMSMLSEGFKGYYLDDHLYNVLERPDSDHRSINLEDLNVLRKLIVHDVYTKFKQQRIETGSDWLKENKFDMITAFEQRLINDKTHIAEKIRRFALTQIDHGKHENAISLLREAFKHAPFYFSNYRTLLYCFKLMIGNSSIKKNKFRGSNFV